MNVKRQPTEWKKMFVNHVSGRYLISILYKELLQLNIMTNKPATINGQSFE